MNRVFQCDVCKCLWRIDEDEQYTDVCPNLNCLGSGVRLSCNLKNKVGEQK